MAPGKLKVVIYNLTIAWLLVVRKNPPQATQEMAGGNRPAFYVHHGLCHTLIGQCDISNQQLNRNSLLQHAVNSHTQGSC